MAHCWSILDAAGAELRRSQAFPTQSDAEFWLSEAYADLADEGAEAVTLLEDDRVVYGPMSLHA